MKFLIVGTGRCGTTYCTEVLKAAGLNVSHQTLFTFEKLDAWKSRPPTQVEKQEMERFKVDIPIYDPYWEWGDLDGEASFMAVPYLERIKNYVPDLKIIHIWRDEYLVVDSWLRSGVFGDQMAEIYPHFNSLLTDPFHDRGPRERATNFYNTWIRTANEHADTTLHIHDANPAQLIQAVGRYDLYADADGNLTDAAKAMWAVPTDTNRHEGGA